MTDPYTPTTEEIREYIQASDRVTAHMFSPDAPDAAEAFDRWLKSHDAQVRAEALREAATGARSTRFQIHHGEHVTYADTFEAGVRSVQQMLLVAAERAEADLIADTNQQDRSA